MRRLALLIGVALLVFAPASAYAHGGDESSGNVPAQALAVQALAMLDANMGAMDARDRIKAALLATNKEDIRIDRLRAADAALGRNDTATARRELEAAFNSDDKHLIGTSYSGSGTSRLLAGILGAIVVALAGALLLLHRQTSRKATDTHG